MAEPRRTQKQIAERYRGNLGYYKLFSPWRRARFWVSFLTLSVGLAALVLYDRHGQPEFFSTGPIVSAHASFGSDCAQCHDGARPSAGPMTPQDFVRVLSDRVRHGVPLAEIDRKCETCHQQHDFHEPNVVENRSCTLCHREHQGPGAMSLASARDCASCHNNREIMHTSAEKGRRMPGAAFHQRAELAPRAVFKLPRPDEGYTQVFASFAAGHPEFQIDHAKARDPNVLRFNHQRHMATDIPQVEGRKLDCNYCHRPESDGRYMRRISFEANCQACHSLQFDPRNPELRFPHGDPAAVRGFLRALPSQYEALAAQKRLTSDQARRFVNQELLQLRERVRSGEDFEQQVFFATDPYKPMQATDAAARAKFHGCAFCHEVKWAEVGAPLIAKPLLIERWLPHAQFNHTKHASVSCESCHNAAASRETSDVLMPVKTNCVSCHSPAGKVTSECITCHTYHATPTGSLASAAGGSASLKQMLLGK